MATSILSFRGRSALLIAVIAIVVAAVSLAAMARGPQFTVVTGNPAISIETNDLQPGDVRFFVYGDKAGSKIRFLLARDSTGRVQAAVDACQRCSMYHEGYTTSDGRLVCRYCGNRYKLEAMSSGLASCVPSNLPFQMTGSTVKIKSADLEHDRGMF